MWNNLPAQIKLSKSVNTFKHDIKKSFFDDLQKQNDDINPFLMTFKNKMTICSFTIRHSFPNLPYVMYLHDVLYVCATSILSLFSQRDHNENKVYPDLYYAIPATLS